MHIELNNSYKFAFLILSHYIADFSCFPTHFIPYFYCFLTHFILDFYCSPHILSPTFMLAKVSKKIENCKYFAASN